MKLAINGGAPVRKTYFKPKKFYNKEKVKEKVNKIIDSEFLSGYRGSFGSGFWGGEYVRKLESFFEDYLYDKTKKKQYVLAVNSCTSALIAACGAVGLEPEDEVIVTPYSMTCSMSAPMIYGAKPVFSDIEKNYFCLDPNKIEEKINKKTKAIIAVDLFGHPYDSKKINKIAKKHNLFVIEDAAQAIGSFDNDKPAGTLGDIGCFSFTQGKHFTSGEGGFIVTGNHDLYIKCALIRNHAEAVIHSMPKTLKETYSIQKNMIGFNFRMTEIQAAILIEQLKNIDIDAAKRHSIIEKLDAELSRIGFNFCKTRPTSFHSYYVSAMFYDEKHFGISREKFVAAVCAELQPDKHNINIHLSRGVPFWAGYIEPVYKFPLFNFDIVCPNAEFLHKNKLIISLLHGFDLNNDDIDDIIQAINKVFDNIKELK